MVDRSSFTTAPTEIPEDKSSGTRRIEGGYLGLVRRTLLDLGSPRPDDDIARAGKYVENCEEARIDPRVCAAIIYGAEHHRHQVEATTIKEPAGDISAMGASEPVEVLHEPAEVLHDTTIATTGRIVWAKVNRDETLHVQGIELSRRFGPIKNWQKVYEVVGVELAAEQQEVFLVLPLNLRGELMTPPFEVARGQATGVTVSVDDIRPVVALTRCEGFVCVHNHPSGVAHPSPEDRKLDQYIRNDMPRKYLDHVIIGTKCCYSMRKKKLYRVAG